MTDVLSRILRSRLLASDRSVLLLGARQVGKTTLIRSLPLAREINLADERIFLGYAREPARLIREVRAMDGTGIIAIDEVQRVPRLLDSVQVLLDEKCPFRFIITGSSARKLRRGRANLLPGRIILEYLDPLMVREAGESFDLDRAMQVGCLPGIYLDRDYGTDLIGTYALTYLREEIRAEALVRDLGSYSRFLDVAAQSSGQWINYSKLASDGEIPKETVRRFFTLLEDTLIAFRVEPFRPRRSNRRVSQRDRFIFFDLGVRNALLGLHRHPVSPDAMGALFEQFVILQCIYFNRAFRKEWRLSSYRTDAGAEVDLVIDTGESLIGIECKSGTGVRQADLRGLRSLGEIAHLRLRKYVVYKGSERQVFSSGEVAIPFGEFLGEELGRL